MTDAEWEQALRGVIPDHVETTPVAVAEYVRTLRERLAFIGMVGRGALDDMGEVDGD